MNFKPPTESNVNKGNAISQCRLRHCQSGQCLNAALTIGGILYIIGHYLSQKFYKNEFLKNTYAIY